MNPAILMKLMSAKNTFAQNHPKFVAFLQTVFNNKIEEGTIVEISVQKPGQEKVTSNIKVQQSDLDLLQGLMELGNIK